MKKVFKNQLIRNTFWGAGGNASMAMISFVASIFVVRNLEPSEYGRLQEMVAYFVILQNYENLINFNLFKKELLHHPERSHDLVMTLGVLTSAVGFALFLGVCAAIFAFHLSAQFWFLAILVFACIFRFSNGISYLFDAHLETKKSQVSLNLGNAVASGYRITTSFLSPTAWLQAFAIPVQYFSTCMVHLFQYKKKNKFFLPIKWRFKECLGLVALSFPVFLSSCADVFKERIPYIYMGAKLSPQEIGYFSAGVKLVEPWIFVASALSISFWPKLVYSFKNSEESYRKSVTYYFSAVFYFFVSIAMLEYFLSFFLVNTVISAKYAAATPVLKVQCLALVFQALNMTFATVELNEGLAKNSLYRNLLSLGVVVVSLLYFVPLYGKVGASQAILASNAFACLVAPLFFKKSRNILKKLCLSPVLGPKYFMEYVKSLAVG